MGGSTGSGFAVPERIPRCARSIVTGERCTDGKRIVLLSEAEYQALERLRCHLSVELIEEVPSLALERLTILDFSNA